MMKEIVQDRLNKMEDLQQRRLLKNLMTGVFLNLVEYQEQMVSGLERRVFEEIGEMDDRHDVYVTMCHRSDFDPIHEYLYPMLPEDVEPTWIDLGGRMAALQEGQGGRLFRLFLELETEQIREIIQLGTEFEGEIVTNEGQYPIRVTLQPCLDYIQEIEKLYDVFQKNGLAWKSLHHPYAYKFVDVMLVGWKEAMPSEAEEIVEISLDLGAYGAYQRPELIPLWNIEKLARKNSGFPVPAVDRVNYEHVLSLKNTGTEHGYLVDGEEANIRYIKRTEDELTIVSPQEKSGIWHLWKITRPVTAVLHKSQYPLVSNRRQDSFLGRYTANQGQIIRSQGEIRRIIHSFDCAQGIELDDIEILQRHYPLAAHAESSTACTYPLNTFINDQIRMEKYKPVMRLQFRLASQIASGEQFILDDLLSFLVAEVQMVFPEYVCEGEWT